jgi:hypothetical protein
MKHLKKFNEILKSDEIDELKDFCETSLAYLYDEGYNVSLSVRDFKYPESHIIVSLGLPEENGMHPNPGYRKFHWNDVKDYYIPFLQMLVRRYELLPYRAALVYTSSASKIKQDGIIDEFTPGNDYVYFNSEAGIELFSIDEVINDRVGSKVGTRLWGINIKVVDKI